MRKRIKKNKSYFTSIGICFVMEMGLLEGTTRALAVNGQIHPWKTQEEEGTMGYKWDT